MKKRLTIFITIISLIFMYSGSFAVFAEEDGNENTALLTDAVKVGLVYGSSAVSSADLICSGGFSVMNMDVSGTSIEALPEVTTEQAIDAAGGTVSNEQVDDTASNEQTTETTDKTNALNTQSESITVVSENGVINIKDSNTGEVIFSEITEQNVIMPNTDSLIEYNGKKYRGGICFTINSNGSLNVVNYINCEHYVYGVLNAEMNYSNPLEALKAQATVARSFAIAAREGGGRHSSYGFDVCSTTHCQVYRGYEGEKELTNKAVDETSGLCLIYEEKPVMGYYHKNSGGYTLDVKNVWGSDMGYLKPVNDSYSPEYYWEKTYTFSELEDILENSGKNIGTLQKIAISTYYIGAKEPIKLIFTGSNGTAEYKAESIRSLLGYSTIKSLNFVFSGTVKNQNIKEPEEELPELNQPENLDLYVWTDNKAEVLSGSFYVVDLDGAISQLNGKGIYVCTGAQTVQVGGDEQSQTQTPSWIGGSGTDSNNSSNNDSNSNSDNDANSEPIQVIEGSLVETSGQVKFTGLGYGHGIGMAQDSAVQMAKEGFTFDDILRYYYTDITISKIDELETK